MLRQVMPNLALVAKEGMSAIAGAKNATEEDIAFWTDIFETYRKVITHAKRPKTRDQIVKWLRDPHLDSSEYRLWGNGVALPCVWFVLAGIVYYDQFRE